MSIEELELVVSRLAEDELALFSRWFDEFRAQQWDRQIEADVRAGKLDAAGQRADDDYEAGRCKRL
jgi:hypothetical protein